MLAKDVLNFQEVYCTSDTPLASVFEMLLANECECVTVVESLAHKNPIGSVSEHDICLKTIRDGLNPQRLTAGRVMNGNFTTVSAEASLIECAALMKKHDCRKLLVVDEDGAYRGIVTESVLAAEPKEKTPRLHTEPYYACPVVLRDQPWAY